ncbi:MAG: M1 family aminopeptidase [Ginsengibacter sp.]
MNRLFVFLLFFSLCKANLFAQSNSPVIESPSGINSSGYSGTGSNIDVVYHRMWLRVNPDSTLYIKGYVQTNFVTTQNNVSNISFDLNSVFTIDSVYYQGAKLPAGNIIRSGNIFNIVLSGTLPINTIDSVKIFYQGVPPAPFGGFPEGFRKYTLSTASYNNADNYITTLSESYEDRDWWPCKADMQDKIDSMEISLNVPWAFPAARDTFWGIANGMLVDSAISGNSRSFTYKTNYPIASYLVGVSVGRFNHYYRGTVNISGTNVPVVYHLLADRKTSYATNIANLDKMNLVLVAFSQKFGDYPFKKEKHGYYDGLVGAGGMEHQTSSCINTASLNSLTTIAHELMHQWFGDNVTTATWNDLWLAEGFARYSEALVAELVPSLGLSAYSRRNTIKTTALGLSGESAWIPDASASNSVALWGSNYGKTVYDRGAMVASMLRALSGDAIYFQALRNYQAGRALNFANTDTLKNYFNAMLNVDISEFFRDYVGGSGPAATAIGGVGNPVYSINWNSPSVKKLAVQVASQTKSSGSNVSYFDGPVVLHVKGSLVAQDTTIVFFDWGLGNLSYAGNGLSAPVAGNLLTYNLSFTPISVAYDDSARTLSTGSTSKLSTLALRVADFSAFKVSNGNQITLSILRDQQISKVTLLRSVDGIDFKEIGEMTTIGNSNQLATYQLNDHNSGSSTIFYKAKIVSDDNYEFTKIIKVDRARNIGITVTPNPVNNNINLDFNNMSTDKVTIHIINSAGNLVKEITTANKSIHIPSQKLSNGIYEIRIMQNNRILDARKIIIQH